jgi:hypothetical protein
MIQSRLPAPGKHKDAPPENCPPRNKKPMHLHRRNRSVLLLLQLDRGYPPLVHHPSQRLSLLASVAQLLHGRTIWRRCHSSFPPPGTTCLRMALGPPMEATEATIPRRDGTQGRTKRRNPRRKHRERIAPAGTHAPLPFKAAPSSSDLTPRPATTLPSHLSFRTEQADFFFPFHSCERVACAERNLSAARILNAVILENPTCPERLWRRARIP